MRDRCIKNHTLSYSAQLQSLDRSYYIFRESLVMVDSRAVAAVCSWSLQIQLRHVTEISETRFGERGFVGDLIESFSFVECDECFLNFVGLNIVNPLGLVVNLLLRLMPGDNVN